MAGRQARMAMGCLAATAALCAEPAQAQLAPTWQASWDSQIGVSGDEAVRVIAVPTGGSLMAVVSNDEVLSLVRHDADGQRLWEQVAVATVYGNRVDLVLADDGSAIIAAIDPVAPALVVRRFDSDTGALQWQRQRPMTSAGLTGRHAPTIALDRHTGHVRIAASDNGDWLILDYAGDGTPGPEIVSGSPDQIDFAKAIVVDGPGRVVVAGYELGDNSLGSLRVVAFDADGKPRYTDRETGDVDTVFLSQPMAISLTDDGGVLVLGGPESRCGSFQARLWRLDAAGQRVWTQIWPTSPCSPFAPVAMAPLADGSVIVVDSRRSAAVRIAADGRFLWQHPGTGFGTEPTPASVLADGEGRVRVMGFVSPGAQGSARPHLIEWTTDGGLCAVETGAEGAYGVIAMALLPDGWLAAGIGPPATWPGSDAVLLRYPRVDPCTAPGLFAGDFEVPAWPFATGAVAPAANAN